MESSGNTTIASFIERFRREPPRSREERGARAKEDKGLFWWQDSSKQGAQPYAEVDEHPANRGSHELLVEDLGDEFLNVDELNRRADEILARHKHLLEPAEDEEEDCKSCARSPGSRSPRLPLGSSPTAVIKGHGNSRPSDDVPLNTSLLSRASTASRRSNAADSLVYSEASSDDNLLGLAFVDAENLSEWTPPPSPPPQTSRRARLSSPPPSPPPPPPPPAPLPPSSGHRRRRQNRVQGSDQLAESHVHVFVHVDPVKPTTTVPNSRRLLTPLALDAQDNRIDALHPVSASASESPSHLSQAVEQHLDNPPRANPGPSEPMAECEEEATNKQNAQALHDNKKDEHVDQQPIVRVEQDITEGTKKVVNEGNMESDDDDQVSVNELLDTILQTVIDITEKDNGVAIPKTAEEVARSTAHVDTTNIATSPPRQQAAAVALSPIRCDETETATSPIAQKTRDSAISPLQVTEMVDVSTVPFPCKTMESAASPLGIEVAEIATSPVKQHVREAVGSPEHHSAKEAATSPMSHCAKDGKREALVQRLEALRARLREIEREEADLEKLCNP